MEFYSTSLSFTRSVRLIICSLLQYYISVLSRYSWRTNFRYEFQCKPSLNSIVFVRPIQYIATYCLVLSKSCTTLPIHSSAIILSLSWFCACKFYGIEGLHVKGSTSRAVMFRDKTHYTSCIIQGLHSVIKQIKIQHPYVDHNVKVSCSVIMYFNTQKK